MYDCGQLSEQPNHAQILDKIIVFSFISFDLYRFKQKKPHHESERLYQNRPDLKQTVERLKKLNLYILSLENKDLFESLIPEIVALGRHLILKRIISQKLYLRKLSFMIDLINTGQLNTSREIPILKFVRFCIEVAILSLNIYNKTVFVTKLEESSLKLKSIVINKPKIYGYDFPFVIVHDRSELRLVFCVTKHFETLKQELGFENRAKSPLNNGQLARNSNAQIADINPQNLKKTAGNVSKKQGLRRSENHQPSRPVQLQNEANHDVGLEKTPHLNAGQKDHLEEIQSNWDPNYKNKERGKREDEEKAEIANQDKRPKGKQRNSKADTYARELDKEMEKSRAETEAALLNKEVKTEKKKMVRKMRHQKALLAKQLQNVVESFDKETELLQMLMIVQVMGNAKVTIIFLSKLYILSFITS